MFSKIFEKKHYTNKAKEDTKTCNHKKIDKFSNLMKYSDDEMNELPYNLAIKYDKKKYCQYYISLLKTKHILIFSFFQSNDYNSKIIKIALFFIGFAIYYSVNCLFFNDETMHKIYENKGAFDFVYQLPKILYSSLVSIVLNSILNLLALSNGGIIKFKENRTKKNLDTRKADLEQKLRIKFIMHFIISFIMLVCFWYYISMFGVIYKNTQLHLLKDTLISFGLSLIYPFAVYLVPGIFRIPSLSNPKKSRKLLYNFSKFIQLF